MTTEMRVPRYMSFGSSVRRRGLARAAGGERRARGLPAGEPAPGLAQLEARPFLQDGGHQAGVEEDVDGEEALVGAEALRLADEAARLLGLGAEPDLAEVVARVAYVAELAVDEQLAGVDVAVGEHGPAQVPGVARELVLVRAHHLGDQLVAHDALGVDEVGKREVVVAGEGPRLVLPLHVLGVLLV